VTYRSKRIKFRIFGFKKMSLTVKVKSDIISKSTLLRINAQWKKKLIAILTSAGNSKLGPWKHSK